MREQNFGSKYNPTGNPSFYSPFTNRIDVIVCGNTQRMAGTGNHDQGPARAIIMRDKETDAFIREFGSVAEASEKLNVSPSTVRNYIHDERGKNNVFTLEFKWK